MITADDRRFVQSCRAALHAASSRLASGDDAATRTLATLLLETSVTFLLSLDGPMLDSLVIAYANVIDARLAKLPPAEAYRAVTQRAVLLRVADILSNLRTTK